MMRARRTRGVTTVEWVIVAMIIGVGCIAVFRTFKDSYMAPATNRMGDCIEAAAGDGNLCGGLAVGGASSGGVSNGVGGNGASGPLAQNGGAPAAGGGLSGNELANSVGENHGGESHGGETGRYENPHAGIINAISQGFGLFQAAEDALIDAFKEAHGIEVPAALDWAYRGARTAEGALIGLPLDLLAQGMPHSYADGASFAVKNGIIAAVGFFGTPAMAAGAVALDKSLGYLADSITGGTRYQDDWQDSIAWRMVHGQAGTIGREGVEAEQARERQMIHEQLDYMRQQRELEAQALRDMMPRR